MKHPNCKLLVLLALIFPIIAFSQTGKGFENQPISKLPAKEKRWALIIGVDAYQKDISPLYGTVNDAKALRDVLIKSAGFTDERIILMTTDSNDSDLIPTRGNIIDQLDKLQRVVPEDGLILFSFSGHGVSIGSDAFIVPADGRIYQNADLMRERAIDVLRIKRAIQDTKVKQVIMFLDACRNDPVRAKGDVDNNLTTAYANGFSFEAKNQNIEAYATLYATSFGDRAYEFLDKKTGKYRGYFSYAIEEALKGSAANEKGEITLAGLIRYIEDTVKERVRINLNERQIPYPTTEGFRNSDLVIAVANKSENNSLTAAQIAWNNFRGLAKNLLKYDDIGSISDGMAWVYMYGTNGKYGFIDKTGKEVISPKYDGFPYSFSDGLALIFNDHYDYGFIDKSGKEVVPPQFRNKYYGQANSFSEDLAVVELNGKYGFIDKTGKIIIKPKYDNATAFSEGLASVKLNGKYSFIDKKGKEVVSLKYEYVGKLSESVATVRITNGETSKYGSIDKTGKVIIPIEYDWVSSFAEGFAIIQKDKKQGFIDRNGREITPLKYEHDICGEEYSLFSEEVAQVILNEKFGFIDTQGREIIQPKYNSIWCNAFRKEGFIGVWLNGKKGFVDIYGNEYFDF